MEDIRFGIALLYCGIEPKSWPEVYLSSYEINQEEPFEYAVTHPKLK